MTNREWLLKSLSDRQLAKVIDSFNDCEYCIYNKNCASGSGDCEDGIEKWLREEHKDGEE